METGSKLLLFLSVTQKQFNAGERKLLRQETSMRYKSSLVRRQMRKTNEANYTRQKEGKEGECNILETSATSLFLVAGGRAARI